MANIVFMGTPDIAKESLERLVNDGNNILAVFTATDKPKGRGMKMIFSPVKEYAIQEEIDIYQPTTLRNNEEMLNVIKSLKPDFICVVAYGLILPKSILDIPKYGCINVHPSLLPKYRGPTPIQFTIINGDKTGGVTTMHMDDGMDTGDIIMQKQLDVGENETTGELWNRLSTLGAELLSETVKGMENGTAIRTKQSDDFSVVPMITKDMAKIDWQNKTAGEIKNLIRGLDPILGAYTTLNGRRVKIWKAEKVSINEFIEKYKEFGGYEYRFDGMEPGTIIYIDKNLGIYVKAKDEILLILEIQAENAKRMDVQDYLRGSGIEIAEIFI